MAQYPVFKGRFVMGSLFDLKTTTHDGKPEPDENKYHYFVAFAVPKGPEWDALYSVMYNEAKSDQVGGALCDQPGFNWKVEDCDNPENPLNKGKANRPAGHMLIKMSRNVKMGAFPVVDNSRNPIVNKASVKRGDYFYVAGGTKFNGAQTIKTNAGMYQNIDAVMFAGAGEEIVSEGGFSVANAFAGIQGAAVGGAFSAPAPVSTPAAPAPAGVTPPPPATDLLVTPPPVAPVEEKYNVNGTVYTKAQLLAMPGWTTEHLANLPRA